MRGDNKLDFAESSQLAAQNINAWARVTNKNGNELSLVSPHRSSDGSGGFKVNMHTGVWCDFASGDPNNKGGDFTSLFAYIHNIGQAQAHRKIMHDYGFSHKNECNMEENDSQVNKTSIEKNFVNSQSNSKSGISAGKFIDREDKHEGWTQLPKGKKTDDLPLVVNENNREIYVNAQRWDFEVGDNTVMIVFRLINDGKKVGDFPYTLWKHDNSGLIRWKKGALNEYPLFNLNELRLESHDDVLLFEGQKDAATAQETLIDSHVCTGWYGGAGSTHKTDFTPLKDRNVFYCYDNDKPGEKSIPAIKALAKTIGFDLTIVKPWEYATPEDGTSLADYVEKWDADKLVEYINSFEVEDLEDVEADIFVEVDNTDNTGDFDSTGFQVDYSIMEDEEVFNLIKNMVYIRGNHVDAAELILKSIKRKVFYSISEKYRYFNGISWRMILNINQRARTIIKNFVGRWYNSYSPTLDKKELNNLNKAYNKFLKSIKNTNFLKSVVSELNGFEDFTFDGKKEIAEQASIEWDNNLAGSITLKDTVLDFIEKDDIKFRKGRPEEYRLNRLHWEKKDFDNYKKPVNFIKFLEEIQPDKEDRKTLLQTLAATLSGANTFKKFIVWIGEANSGKSLLQRIWKNILGSYASTFSSTMLLEKKNDVSVAMPELLELKGSLVAFGSETSGGTKKISKDTIKKITGVNDDLTARTLYSAEMINFIPTFQMILLANDMPRFDSSDMALVHRLLFIKFDSCFYSSDEEKEHAELRGAKVIKPAGVAKDIVNKIVAEGPNVIMYLLKEIYKNMDGKIYESPNCVSTKIGEVEINDEVTEFFESNFEFDKDSKWFMSGKHIKEFFNDSNNLNVSTKYLTDYLKKAFPALGDRTSFRVGGSKGVQLRGYKGLRIHHRKYKKSEYPEYIDSYSKAELLLSRAHPAYRPEEEES